MTLIRKDGMIFAPVKEEFGDEPESLLCERYDNGEPFTAKDVGPDLDMCLYSLRNCNTEAGKLPDGEEVILDGQVIGYFQSVHFIPSHD